MDDTRGLQNWQAVFWVKLDKNVAAQKGQFDSTMPT